MQMRGAIFMDQFVCENLEVFGLIGKWDTYGSGTDVNLVTDLRIGSAALGVMIRKFEIL